MENNHYSITGVVTVFNKEDTIKPSLESLLRQPTLFKEIFVVDDGSSDGSKKIIQEIAKAHNNIIAIFQRHQGIVSSLNIAISKATGEYIVVIDGDVILENGWMAKLTPYLIDDKVAAVSGATKLANHNSIWSVLAGYNLEFRQSLIKNKEVDHLSTCSTIYRRSALEKIGLFDERFHYGQDNDLSYRLGEISYKLILAKEACCFHHWPGKLSGFLKQRFNGAIGRMMLSMKHHGRWKGDNISSLRYFLELPVSILFLISLFLSPVNEIFGLISIFMLIAFYLLLSQEIKFFFSKKIFFIGIFLPFFSLLRSMAWLAGVMYYMIFIRHEDNLHRADSK